MNNEASRGIYQDFLPTALSDGSFVPAPEPLVIGTGLQHVKTGSTPTSGACRHERSSSPSDRARQDHQHPCP